ncbi:hypothetical protein C0J52_24477 [Blattella germanica]|nr:hypothetical protein C0J52_24477 [Blattella germanica]
MVEESNWSMEEIENLIFLVQENEALYNPRLPAYNNRDTIDFIWTTIASHIGTKSSKACAKKWQILRAGYRNRRGMIPLRSGNKGKKWIYFDAMSFLEPFITARSCARNPPTENNETESFITADIKDFVFEDTSSTSIDTSEVKLENCEITSSRSECTGSKRKEREAEEDIFTKYLEKKLYSEKEKKTCSMLFLQSLHEDIEKLSERGKRTFKLKVQTLLYEMLEAEAIE